MRPTHTLGTASCVIRCRSSLTSGCTIMEYHSLNTTAFLGPVPLRHSKSLPSQCAMPISTITYHLLQITPMQVVVFARHLVPTNPDTPILACGTSSPIQNSQNHNRHSPRFYAAINRVSRKQSYLLPWRFSRQPRCVISVNPI